MQHTPSRFLQKVAQPIAMVAKDEPCERQAPQAFTRFMQKHPGVSRFMAEHPKTSRFLLNIAHHIPGASHLLHLQEPVAPKPRALRSEPKPPTFY